MPKKRSKRRLLSHLFKKVVAEMFTHEPEPMTPETFMDAGRELLAYDIPITKIIESNSLNNLADDHFNLPFTVVRSERQHNGEWRDTVMMRNLGFSMDLTFKVDELLKKLKKNLEEHKTIVTEAREGYIKEAEKQIQAELRKFRKAVRDGKLIHVGVSINPPQDYSSAYETIIEMLEMCTEEEIELDPDQFRKLVQDRWEWTDQFLGHTQAYSATAVRKAAKLSS